MATSDCSQSSPTALSPPMKQTMLQGFEWHVPGDNKHWKRLESIVPIIAQLGVNSLHLPPACKGFGPHSVGYDIYDLYDLSEFDQKNCVATKYGTKQELVSLARVSQAFGISIIFDVVISHKAGADAAEPVRAVRVEQWDRTVDVGEFEDIQAWTKFEYKGRGGKYSEFVWNKEHFSGVDYDENTKETGVIRRFEGKQWADADRERGNYDYLMFANVDLSNQQVRAELFHWVEWLNEQMPLGGLRLDAIKHMSTAFVKDFVAHAKKVMGRESILAGEYWAQEANFLVKYGEDMNNDVLLYDIRLVHNFKDLSWSDTPDLRTVLDGSLAKTKPEIALTFVVNHDTQEGQTSECLVAPWFVPLAYSIILLHTNGGTPVIFYGDLYGSFGPMGKQAAGQHEPVDHGRRLIPRIMHARQAYAYGPQSEYFDEAHCIGFTRHGDNGCSDGARCAVLMTSCSEAMKKCMFVGEHHAGELWTDLLGQAQGPVEINFDGWGKFSTMGRCVSVWVDADAAGRAEIDVSVFNHDIYGLEK